MGTKNIVTSPRQFLKETQSILQYIDECELYRQSGGATPFYILSAFDGVHETFEPGVMLIVMKREIADIYIDKQQMIARAKKTLEQELQGRSATQQEYLQWCRARDEHDHYVETLKKMDLKNASMAEVVDELRSYNAVNHELWRYSFVIDCFDPTGAEMLEEQVWAHYPELHSAQREVLLKQFQLTSQELMERSALQLLIDGCDDVAKQLKDQFHWIENNYTGVRDLPLEYFLNSSDKISARFSTPVSKKQRVEALDMQVEQLKKEKKQLFERHKISVDHQRVIALFTFLTEWREERKRNTQMMAWCYQQFVDALAQHWHMDTATVAQAHCEEYDLFQCPTDTIRDTLERRRSTGLIYAMDNRSRQRYLIDDPAEIERVTQQISNKLYEHASNKIRGTVARKGKIEGIVRIVNHLNDFEKFNLGDILVSGMTRPELMPVLRKASGIITDEGGITCHAAVISRELNIPCLIGTQVATKVLKDGDRVLLDADTGVIQKLNS